MSTARFARSGRVRICILMSMFIVLIMMIVIYHMSQQQLDETRAFRIRCEQNQEGLNMQLQSLTDDKLSAEKKVEVMHGEKQRMQEDYEKQQAEERTLKKKYDEQIGKYKVLDAKHNDLQAEYAKNKKQHMEDRNSLLLQVQQLQQDKKLHDTTDWKIKYETLLRESEHKTQTLEAALNEFRAHCSYMLQGQQLNKPSDLLTPDTTPARRSSPGQLAHSIEKPRNDKSFNEQVQIVPKSVKTLADDTDKQQQQEHPIEAAAAAANALVSPLSAPRKSSSSTPNVEPAPNASVASKIASSSSSTGQPPIAIPPAKPSTEVKMERKLPENVAPIPDNFDGKGELAADADTAAEELPKNENNNRYSNVVNDLESNKNQGGLDSGAHEVKDALNEKNFNLPGANSNLFDAEVNAGHAQEADNKLLAADIAAVGGGGGVGGGDDDDDDDVMLGDVAVKQHMLDGDNLNNEIAADQGKELADAVHVEDNMDEDQDEDDYNVRHKPGADAAVRN
ncbi:uncharacterized protein DDB_G0284459 isoform X2 [Drosophila innubila]|uniref:uncharacterized protein DDB_G0284459 isoform X2 n=1 Tax=Drosophila innubila TaxID=198719 RepID=UPI00148E7B36|nr:uncharacterized protein DDB_G0284459 isoform X2 [Drosophila innubila]